MLLMTFLKSTGEIEIRKWLRFPFCLTGHESEAQAYYQLEMVLQVVYVSQQLPELLLQLFSRS